MVKLGGWEEMLRRIAEGDHPSDRELGDLIERQPLPDEARPYVAARLRDEVHLGDGGRPRMRPLERYFLWYNRETWRLRIEICRERYRRVRLHELDGVRLRRRGLFPADWRRCADGRWRVRRPLEFTIRRLSQRSGIKRSTLESWWRHKEKAPDTNGHRFREVMREILKDMDESAG